VTTAEAAQNGVGVPEWTLGWRLQRALAHAEIGAQEMADELGVTRSTISRWMHDRGAEPRAIYIKQWALRTGVPVEWLQEESGVTRSYFPAERHLVVVEDQLTASPGGDVPTSVARNRGTDARYAGVPACVPERPSHVSIVA
jgi:transcriptional regulator with XRE-family HTH domain